MTPPRRRSFRTFCPASHAEQKPAAGWGRRRFIGVCLAACLAPALRAQPAAGESENFRGGKVDWARLKNSGQYWNRHANSDPELLDFLRRNSSLNIDPTWHAASAKSLSDICNYPFLFADRIENLDPGEQTNLGEYLRRGGFICIDCCCNTGINPSPDDYLLNQLQMFHTILPDVSIKPLPENHEIYSLYFKLERHPPRAMPGNSWMDTSNYPLHGISVAGRLVGILTMSGLQCGWAHVGSPDNAQECLEMMTNLYIYAITH